MTLIAGSALIVAHIDDELREYDEEKLANEWMLAEAMRARIGQGAGLAPSGPAPVPGFLADADDREASEADEQPVCNRGVSVTTSAGEPAPRSRFAHTLTRIRGWADGWRI